MEKKRLMLLTERSGKRVLYHPLFSFVKIKLEE